MPSPALERVLEDLRLEALAGGGPREDDPTIRVHDERREGLHAATALHALEVEVAVAVPRQDARERAGIPVLDVRPGVVDREVHFRGRGRQLGPHDLVVLARGESHAPERRGVGANQSRQHVRSQQIE